MAWHTKKSWTFRDLVTVISAALNKSFVCSKYTFSVSQFLLYWMWIICCIYKDFVWKLKAFLPSFCHSCTCEMFPGWGHLITWKDPTMGHLKGILARKGVIWTAIVKKVKCLGGVAGGDDVEASIWPIHNGMGYIFLLVEMLQVSLIFVSFSLTLFMFPKPVYKTSKPQHIYWQNGRCWYIRCF